MAITRELKDAEYNAFSTTAAPVVDYSNLVQAAGIGIKAGIKQNETDAQEELVGPEGSQVPGIEGLGEARTQPGREFDMDKALNLRQIKRAKEQGLLSATQARIKVGQAIRAVSEDFPGNEDALRKRAGVYFGKFGEGDLTLTKSSEQKQQEAIFVSSFLKPGVAAGIINANDPFGDEEGQANWQRLTHDATIRSQTKDVIQTQAEIGKASALSAGNAYIESDVADDIATVVNGLIKQQESGQAIVDPLKINNMLNVQRIRHQGILMNRLSRIKGVTPAQKKAAREELDAKYASITKHVENGSLQKMIEQRSSLIKETAILSGVNSFTSLLEAEAVSPGIGSALANLAPIFERLGTSAARENFVSQQPPIMRALIRSTINEPMGISELMSETIASNTVTGNEFFDSLFLKVAKDGSKGKSEVPEEKGKDFKDHSISYIIKNAPKIGSLEDLNNATISARINGDPKMINLLSNKFTAHETSIIPRSNTVITDGNERGRKVDVTFDDKTHKFKLNIGVDVDAKRSPEESPSLPRNEETLMINNLNILYDTIDRYGPALKIDPIEWTTRVLEIINKPVETQE